MKPPRALWVSFDLGRPLGSAAEPEFQKDVIRAAFNMLDSATTHTIDDYPHDSPDEAQAQQWACPLNLGPATDDSLTGRLLGEVARLKPWSAQTRVGRGGRTLFGASGAGADQVDEVAKALAEFAASGDLDTSASSDVEWAFDMPLLVRHLADDLRTHYHEAIAAQPGNGAPNHAALNKWIFGGTALGDTLLAAADQLTELDTGMAKLVRGLLIPEGHYRGGNTFGDR
jgi:hypothetical protein